MRPLMESMIIDSVDIGFPLDLVAKADVGDRHGKERYGDDDVNNIDH